MANILILGAAGQIARLATRLFLARTSDHLVLYLRHPGRLKVGDPARETVVDGDANDVAALTRAMAGQDLVYANLAGDDIESQARAVVAAMRAAGIRRLVWISTLGIYDEVPGPFGKWNRDTLGDYLTTYAAAARVIEGSGLDYTLVRPAWLTDKDEIDYETTEKGEPFKGTEVSRLSVADLVVRLATHPERHVHGSLGVDKPGSEGDRPAWYR